MGRFGGGSEADPVCSEVVRRLTLCVRRWLGGGSEVDSSADKFG